MKTVVILHELTMHASVTEDMHISMLQFFQVGDDVNLHSQNKFSRNDIIIYI